MLTTDYVREWATTVQLEKYLEIKKEIYFPHSLGLLYCAFTYYLGFRVNSGEYKMMGLTIRKPKYSKIIKEYLVDIKEDGSFRLNQILIMQLPKMINKKFNFI